ncbi:putative Major facilitator superfamily (MFS) profile domain-containing protein [Seiridium cardinale]|uniref:Major facilitator superfamily (MFS) profile domain-containing protein n=1 Tax=Seiridium cardinale TaxID=138064 RepID=A0ABR2Y0N9_9PEZI
MFGMRTHIEFRDHDPSDSKNGASQHVDGSPSELDYSPLPRITARSLCMGALVSMGGLIFGYDTGQISGFLEMPDFLRRFGELQPDGQTYAFSNVRSGLVVGLLSIGTLIGALVAAPIADRIGRRISICLWCIVVSVGFIIQVASMTAWEQIMVGRLVAGFGVGALSLLVPMYQSETAPPWIRGALVCTYQLFITLGIFLAACFNYGTYTHQQNNSASWRIVIGLGWLWTLILGIGMLAFSETPRFDYRRGRIEEAKKTLMRVYGAPANHYAIHVQMEEIRTKLQAETVDEGGPIKGMLNMFRGPRMSYRIVIGMLLQMFQQLTGANYFFYYGTTIFKSVQISSFVTQMILNGINFGVTFIGLYLVEHYGRRKSLITGSIWMFICFMIFASIGHFLLDLDTPTNTPTAGIVLIVFACLFILGYATTWGPMVWTLIAEIYPSRYRAKAMALATASNWIWNFLIAFFTPFITSAIDFRYGYVFAACNLVGGALVYFFVLEGQGRTLEEIDTMYVEHVNPRKSSKWVAPPPEVMERIRKEAGTEVSTTPPESGNGQNGVLEGR